MAACVFTCTCEVCSKARTKIHKIFNVLDIYGWLLDSYVVDFFEARLWDKLPNSWKLVLQAVSPEEFAKWLANDISGVHVWPLSLLALREATKNLQINRNHQNDESTLRCDRAKMSEHNFEDAISRSKSNESHGWREALTKKYNNLLLKHVKMKKRHEVEQMTQICANCARQSNVRCITDVGAGMGHLARSLAFKYGLQVACLEQDSLLSQQARKWDRELSLSVSKHLPDLPINLPQHVSIKVGSTDSDQADTVKNVQQVFADNFNPDRRKTGFGIVGLHPCGDLAATLLRLYISKCEARFICIVGCCYMKLTQRQATDVLCGYPLSKYLSSFTNRKLSYAALEVACHAIENYCDKLKTGNYEDLIVHAYRAALETILIKRSERLRRTQVRSVKVTRRTTFQQYCAAATANFESHLRPDDSDFQDPRVERFLSRWRQIVIFGALRAMLAPLIETVVLLDRFLYLSENNLPPTLKPVFDARLSPRNFLLSSVKNCEQWPS